MRGIGSQTSPYIISSPSDLQAINKNLSAYYELENNIDMSGFSFTPIGRAYPFFQGHLDGKGFVVSNLRIVSSGIDYTGFIARTNGGSIQNIGFDNIYVQSNHDNVGGLIGSNSLSDFIRNCYVQGTVTQTDANKSYCGGLVARNYGNVSDCYTDVTVTGGSSVGGFSGLIDYANSTIKNCYSNSQVSGRSNVGAFFGENGSKINYENCYYNSQSNNAAISGIEGRSINELKNQLTYQNWDFKSTWYIHTDLPKLRVFGIPKGINKEIVEVVSTVSTLNNEINTLKSANIELNSRLLQINSDLKARRSVLRVFEEYLSSINSNVTQSHLRRNRAIRGLTSHSNAIFTNARAYYPLNTTPVYVRTIVSTNNSDSIIQCNMSTAEFIINPSQSEVT